jgi:hypothetical protein
MYVFKCTANKTLHLMLLSYVYALALFLGFEELQENERAEEQV